MKAAYWMLAGLCALTAGALPGCADDDAEDDGASGASLEYECEVIGTLCHAGDDGEGPVHECHELGHVGEPNACRAEFAGCMTECLPDEEPNGEAGASAGGGSGTAHGSPYCRALGELCHAADDEDGPIHECHELGHIGDPDVCLAEFDRCAELCLEAREEAEAGEGGGSGH